MFLLPPLGFEVLESLTFRLSFRLLSFSPVVVPFSDRSYHINREFCSILWFSRDFSIPLTFWRLSGIGVVFFVGLLKLGVAIISSDSFTRLIQTIIHYGRTQWGTFLKDWGVFLDTRLSLVLVYGSSRCMLWGMVWPLMLGHVSGLLSVQPLCLFVRHIFVFLYPCCQILVRLLILVWVLLIRNLTVDVIITLSILFYYFVRILMDLESFPI